MPRSREAALIETVASELLGDPGAERHWVDSFREGEPREVRAPRLAQDDANPPIAGAVGRERPQRCQLAYVLSMHLAQLNIAWLVDDQDSDAVQEFMRSIEAINLLGSASPGFVWILAGDDGPGATEHRLPGYEDDERLVVNLTVWEDFDSFHHFVTRSGHAMYVRRRREWFEKADEATTVLWWIEEGHIPDLDEAADRLARLRSAGPSPEAFDMVERYDPDGRRSS